MNELHPDWITHRLPTAGDADGEGDVKVPYNIDCLTKGPGYSFYYLHYSVAVPGQPWWSEKAAANATTVPASPAPARKVVQIAIESPPTEGNCSYIYALCNDSTIHFYAPGTDKPWRQLPPIPQPGDR